MLADAHTAALFAFAALAAVLTEAAAAAFPALASFTAVLADAGPAAIPATALLPAMGAFSAVRSLALQGGSGHSKSVTDLWCRRENPLCSIFLEAQFLLISPFDIGASTTFPLEFHEVFRRGHCTYSARRCAVRCSCGCCGNTHGHPAQGHCSGPFDSLGLRVC